MKIEEKVTLAPYTTFGIGGPARYFVKAHSREEVQEALSFAEEHSLPLFVLGGGSNILISDEGFSGLVLFVQVPGMEWEEKENMVRATVGAGVEWDEFVAESVSRGLAGLECLSGIPGTVGGAVVANAGAYGQQCSDVLVEVETIDSLTHKGRTFKNQECDFSYHDGLFSREPNPYLILYSTFELPRHRASLPAYKDSRFDLAALASTLGHGPSVSDVRNAVLDIREKKGNLIKKGRTSFKGAGSFFHMPFVSAEKYASIAERARSLDPLKEERLRPWAWKEADGSYKIAPGFLLEYTEFQKGFVRGNVGISPLHTLAIINVGGAKAQEVVALADEMEHAIEKMFGLSLTREVKYVGFE